MGNSSSFVFANSLHRVAGGTDFNADLVDASSGESQLRALELTRLIEGLSSEETSCSKGPRECGSLFSPPFSDSSNSSQFRSRCDCAFGERQLICVWRLSSRDDQSASQCKEECLPLWRCQGLVDTNIITVECAATATATAPKAVVVSTDSCVEEALSRPPSNLKHRDDHFSDIDSQSCYIILHGFSPQEPQKCGAVSPTRRKGNRQRRQYRYPKHASPRPSPPRETLEEEERKVRE